MKAKIKCRGTNLTISHVSKYMVRHSETEWPLHEVFNGGKRIASFHHWSYIILENEEST